MGGTSSSITTRLLRKMKFQCKGPVSSLFKLQNLKLHEYRLWGVPNSNYNLILAKLSEKRLSLDLTGLEEIKKCNISHIPGFLKYDSYLLYALAFIS